MKERFTEFIEDTENIETLNNYREVFKDLNENITLDEALMSMFEKNGADKEKAKNLTSQVIKKVDYIIK